MTHHNQPLHVLKLGGGAGVQHQPALDNLAARLKQGERWILVHGASALADQLAHERGLPVRTITSPGGHTSRYTDAQVIAVFAEAAARLNEQLSSYLAGQGIAVAPFPEAGLVRAQRKTAIRAIRRGRPVVIRDDYSGSITGLDEAALQAALNGGQVPVVAPLALGTEGEALNVDGDLAAATIVATLGAQTLVILSNVPGLLRDLDDPASLVGHIPLAELDTYAPLAQGRMKKKLLATRQAPTARVILATANRSHPLDAALNGDGTHIVHSPLPQEDTHARS